MERSKNCWNKKKWGHNEGRDFKSKEYCEQFSAIKLENLDKMDSFLEILISLKVTQEKRENFHTSKTMKEIELGVYNLQSME